MSQEMGPWSGGVLGAYQNAVCVNWRIIGELAVSCQLSPRCDVLYSVSIRSSIRKCNFRILGESSLYLILIKEEFDAFCTIEINYTVKMLTAVIKRLVKHNTAML